MQNNHSIKKLGIIGAGPVGSLLSLYLSRLGYHVEVYERRADMRHDKLNAGRSINLALSTRGLHALKEVGLEETILKQALPMKGRMIHSIRGDLSYQPYGIRDEDCIWSISRRKLNEVLMDQAETTGQVKLFFHQKALEFDAQTGNILFLDETSKKTYSVAHTPWFSADGSSSVIRNNVASSSEATLSIEPLDYGYKEITLPAGPGGSFLLEKNCLHIWPRGSFMLIALPNLDGSFTCTLFLPHQGATSFEKLHNTESMTEFFKTQFPDLFSLIPKLNEEYFSNPVGTMTTVKCPTWQIQDKVLLVGDSAHGIVPFFGQGLNCGFEDCTVLNQILQKSQSWLETFQHFFQSRKVNTDRIADMAAENFIEMRDKVSDAHFLMEKSVEKILQVKFPGEYLSRYSMVTFSRLPYSQAYRAGCVSDEILQELCRDIDKAEDVNLNKAADLIRNKFAPVLK